MADSKTVHVDISGAIKKMERAELDMDKAVPKLLKKISGYGESTMKKLVPVDTGNLRNSITSYAHDDYATINASANYAHYVNDGTRPHVIVPKNANVMRFVIGGNVIYTKRVNHPGTKGAGFIEATVKKIKAYAPGAATQIVKQELAELN